MNSQFKSLAGAWIEAIGTFVSAVGSTPSKLSLRMQKELSLIGNFLQASGSGFSADSETSFNLNKLANEIQAIGNLAIISELLLPFDQQTAQTLNTKGNLLQALGGGIAFSEGLKESVSISNTYIVYGNLLQTIGNSLQALSGRVGSEQENLNALGSWIQTIGAVIAAIGQTAQPQSQ